MKARVPEAELKTPGQHVVTQALLRRFTVPTPHNAWELVKLDLLSDPVRSRPGGPGGSGKIRDFVPYASTSLEAFWGRIEDNFPAAFAAVDDGSLFDPQQFKTLSVVRDMAALHFVRSSRGKRNHEASFREAVAQQRAFWRRRPADLYRFYRRETGLIAETPGSVDYIINMLFKDNIKRAEAGAILREQMENLYQRIRTVLETFNVEIWSPPQGAEFLIGDAPAVLCDPHPRLVELARGAALLDADVALALPLGPRSMAWLHRDPSSGYRQITATEAENANAIQILAAETNAFARPGTSFEAFADQVRKNQRYPSTPRNGSTT